MKVQFWQFTGLHCAGDSANYVYETMLPVPVSSLILFLPPFSKYTAHIFSPTFLSPFFYHSLSFTNDNSFVFFVFRGFHHIPFSCCSSARQSALFKHSRANTQEPLTIDCFFFELITSITFSMSWGSLLRNWGIWNCWVELFHYGVIEICFLHKKMPQIYRLCEFEKLKKESINAIDVNRYMMLVGL